MTGTVLSVTGAVVVLNMTLYSLGRPDPATVTPDSTPTSAPHGDGTTMSQSPHLPAVISFAALGLAGIITFVALFFYILGNGISESFRRGFFGRANPNADKDVSHHVAV